MSDGTHIEWTDATWQIITGCSIESAGCKNCYAMKLAGGRLRHHPSRIGLTQMSAAGPVWTGEVRFNDVWLDQPIRWGRSRQIFVCAHGDLFHESVPFEWIDKVFSVMLMTPQHTYQVFTKRAQRMRAYIDELVAGKRPLFATAEQVKCSMDSPLLSAESLGAVPRAVVMPENIWLGVSVENQATADDRIHHLLRTHAAKRWLSCEPLLGRIDLQAHLTGHCPEHDFASGFCTERRHRGVQHIDWIVVGGESGPGARAMHSSWVRAIRDVCQTWGTAFFFKQWGAWAPATTREDLRFLGDLMRAGKAIHVYGDDREPDGHFRKGDEHLLRVTKKEAGRLLDGKLYEAYPA